MCVCVCVYMCVCACIIIVRLATTDEASSAHRAANASLVVSPALYFVVLGAPTEPCTCRDCKLLALAIAAVALVSMGGAKMRGLSGASETCMGSHCHGGRFKRQPTHPDVGTTRHSQRPPRSTPRADRHTGTPEMAPPANALITALVAARGAQKQPEQATFVHQIG